MELQRLLAEKKRLVEAKHPVAAAAQEVPPAPEDVPPSTPMNGSGLVTPPTNGFRLPGSPHGPHPPSPTSPASTYEPEETKTTYPQPKLVPTPVRAEGKEQETHTGQDGQASPDFFLHESQDRQVWSLKESRKQNMVDHAYDSPVEAVSGDPYAATVLDSPEKQDEEPRLVLHIDFKSPKPTYRNHAYIKTLSIIWSFHSMFTF